MADIKAIFREIAQKDRLGLWVSASTFAIQKFAQKIQPASPYKDKAADSEKSFTGKFWTRRDTEAGLIYLFGIAPNLIYMRGAKAPFEKYHGTKEYTFFGRKTGKFYTVSKAQTLSPTVGVDYKVPNDRKIRGFFTASTKRIGNGKKLIFGRNEYDGASIPYAKDSYADFLYKNYKFA